MQGGKYPYPIQLANIKKNQWRLEKFINLGYDKKELQKKEGELWQEIKKIADSSSRPPNTCPAFPDSKFIGYGWEWAVYELPNKREIVKVPANIFKEVNEPEYLENTRYAYEACTKHLRSFVVDTTFERIKNNNRKINILKQRKIIGKEITSINTQKVNPQLRKNLSIFAKGILALLEEHDWIPDLHLKSQEGSWDVWNLMIENDKPILFDFTAYYDVWRLYPQRTREEKKIKGKYWRDFLNEINK